MNSHKIFSATSRKERPCQHRQIIQIKKLVFPNLLAYDLNRALYVIKEHSFSLCLQLPPKCKTSFKFNWNWTSLLWNYWYDFLEPTSKNAWFIDVTCVLRLKKTANLSKIFKIGSLKRFRFWCYIHSMGHNWPKQSDHTDFVCWWFSIFLCKKPDLITAHSFIAKNHSQYFKKLKADISQVEVIVL